MNSDHRHQKVTDRRYLTIIHDCICFSYSMRNLIKYRYRTYRCDCIMIFYRVRTKQLIATLKPGLCSVGQRTEERQNFNVELNYIKTEKAVLPQALMSCPIKTRQRIALRGERYYEHQQKSLSDISVMLFSEVYPCSKEMPVVLCPQYALVLCNSIGTPQDSKYIDIGG